MSLAFSMLFHRGRAEFITPRPRTSTLPAYVQHLQYHDGRFAKHPRFRFVRFNTIARHQAFVTDTLSKDGSKHGRLTVVKTYMSLT